MWEIIDEEVILKDKSGKVIVSIDKEGDIYIGTIYNSNLNGNNFLRSLFRWTVKAETLEEAKFLSKLKAIEKGNWNLKL
jgi:hypothetical protein